MAEKPADVNKVTETSVTEKKDATKETQPPKDATSAKANEAKSSDSSSNGPNSDNAETPKSPNNNNEFTAPASTLPAMTEDGRHRLESSWTIWYDKKDKSKGWEENLEQIGTFDTVEDFWRFYSYLKKPASLPKDANYHIFRAGQKPMWENWLKGGCFIKKIKKPDGVSDAILLNRMWEELVFAAIGEEFADPGVVGIVLSIRAKEDVLSVWNSDTKNHGLRHRIGEKLKEIWQLDPHTPLEYKNLAAAMKDGSSYRRHVQQIYVP